jgi:hypothetical protein
LIKGFLQKQSDVENLDYIDCIPTWGRQVKPEYKEYYEKHGIKVISELDSNSRQKLKVKFLSYLDDEFKKTEEPHHNIQR